MYLELEDCEEWRVKWGDIRMKVGVGRSEWVVEEERFMDVEVN